MRHACKAVECFDLSKLVANSDVIASRYRAICARSGRFSKGKRASLTAILARSVRNFTRMPVPPAKWTTWRGTFSSTPAEQSLDYASGKRARNEMTAKGSPTARDIRPVAISSTQFPAAIEKGDYVDWMRMPRRSRLKSENENVPRRAEERGGVRTRRKGLKVKERMFRETCG